MNAEEIFIASVKESIKSLIGGGLSKMGPSALEVRVRTDLVVGLPEWARTANEGILNLMLDPQTFNALFVGENHFEVLIAMRRQRLSVGIPYASVISLRDVKGGYMYNRLFVAAEKKVDPPKEIEKSVVDVEESEADRKILPFRPRSARKAPEPPTVEEPGGPECA
jgi:hypothetical protein